MTDTLQNQISETSEVENTPKKRVKKSTPVDAKLLENYRGLFESYAEGHQSVMSEIEETRNQIATLEKKLSEFKQRNAELSRELTSGLQMRQRALDNISQETEQAFLKLMATAPAFIRTISSEVQEVRRAGRAEMRAAVTAASSKK